jgi:hypothetical protein
MSIRRFTRLTNAFSKKIKNHALPWRSGLCISQTLRVTAMESGLSDHVWTIEELCALLPDTASATKRIDKRLILKVLGEEAV